MVNKEDVLEAHKRNGGKVGTIGKVAITGMDDLSVYYTPGVAYVCEAIKADKTLAYEYTGKSNTVAIVSDGTRILGLGDIGPEAGMPVMEGKALLFKKYGGVDAVPLCLDTKDENEIIKVVKAIGPSFGAINIEDIESPKCFRIVDRLSRELSIPVFHDDQQGTAVVVLGALVNALKLAGKDKKARIVVNGAGAAGLGIIRLLSFAGYKNLYSLDRNGIIYREREDLNDFKKEIALKTNSEGLSGGIEEAVKGSDVLISASRKGAFGKEIISLMAEKPITFMLANPEPEISYLEAKEGGAYIAATGRSDTPNQINNLVSFPGIVKGMLEVRASGVNYEMLYAGTIAISKSVGGRLSQENIVPSVLDPKAASRVASNVAGAVAEAAVKTGLASVKKTRQEVSKITKDAIKKYSRLEKRIPHL